MRARDTTQGRTAPGRPVETTRHPFAHRAGDHARLRPECPTKRPSLSGSRCPALPAVGLRPLRVEVGSLPLKRRFLCPSTILHVRDAQGEQCISVRASFGRVRRRSLALDHPRRPYHSSIIRSQRCIRTPGDIHFSLSLSHARPCDLTHTSGRLFGACTQAQGASHS